MDVRKKLVDIVCDPAQINGCIHRCNHPPCAMVGDIVDALIENGVTVQEWISVNDKMPEQGEEAICIAADGDMMIGKYTEWGWMFPCYFEDLTHWMPLPEPPKGE